MLGNNTSYSFGLVNPTTFNVYKSRITGLNYVKEYQCGFAGCNIHGFYINKKDYSKDKRLKKG